ncbi:MAG TPA: hypothetical protein VNA30_05600 [Mycobacteriales bacterium]|nr:hypothetical protein [Mycobacteriales bacterium]
MSPTSTSRHRDWRLLPAAAALLGLALAGCVQVEARPLAQQTLSTADITLPVDGRQRSYLLEPALTPSTDGRAALVVVLHQEGGTPRGVAAETALQELRTQGATLAYPAGVDRSWGAGKCCGAASREGVDDVRFLEAVMHDARRRTRAHPSRTALVGYSSGGMLAYRYVCSRPRTLAAAVVVSGSLESSCDGGKSFPDVLALHGKADGTIGLNRPIFTKALGLAPRPAASTLGILAKSAGCQVRPATTRVAREERRRWEGCRGGSLEALLVTDAGHGWATLDASRRTRDFLRTRLLSG